MNAMMCAVALACAGQIVGSASTHAAPRAPVSQYQARAGSSATEDSLRGNPQTFHKSEVADVARRSAGRGESSPTLAASRAAKEKADRDFWKAQGRIARARQLGQTPGERSATPATERRAITRKPVDEAEKNTADTQATLFTLATVREETRGAVITLSGRILFAFDQTAILPKAQDQLSRVADALMALKDRTFTVYGYTDASDSPRRDPGLSQERAEAVRLFLIARGCSAELIQVQGIGERDAIAGIADAEGRASSPGVEIVITRTVAK